LIKTIQAPTTFSRNHNCFSFRIAYDQIAVYTQLVVYVRSMIGWRQSLIEGKIQLKSLQQSLKTWSKALKKNTYALYLASKDPRVPLLPKILIATVVAYALSPIDLIPDFIPVIGYLDDMLLLPVGIWLAIRLIPDEVWKECQHSAQERMLTLPKSRHAAIFIVVIWLLALAGFGLWLWPLMPVITGM